MLNKSLFLRQWENLHEAYNHSYIVATVIFVLHFKMIFRDPCNTFQMIFSKFFLMRYFPEIQSPNFGMRLQGENCFSSFLRILVQFHLSYGQNIALNPRKFRLWSVVNFWILRRVYKQILRIESTFTLFHNGFDTLAV